MALPVIAAIALGVAALHESNKAQYKRIEQDRLKDDSGSSLTVAKSPSDYYSSHTNVMPTPGSIVCCEVFNLLDHTGIWIDQDTIIELSDSGLVKSVSCQRFMEERSGKNLFVACNHQHEPIVIDGCESRAIQSVFSYREYDVINNNCHRFVNYCLTGVDSELTLFSSLNSQLANLSGRNIYWDKVKIKTY